MKGLFSRSSSREPGFTTVELLVSMTLLASVMVLLVGTVDQTQRVWRRSSEKVTQFQGARAGFESMTRRLSQATLNAYWRAFDTEIGKEKADMRFRRQAELQFLSAPSSRVFGAAPALGDLSTPIEKCYPTHSVFFQAPLGATEELEQGTAKQALRFRNLSEMLTGCGYFIEYGPDPDRPDFLENVPSIPERYRFRLMELTVPSERLTIFRRWADTLGFNDPRLFDENKKFPYEGLVDKHRASNPSWVRPYWLKDALTRDANLGSSDGSHFRYAHTRAENIVALIILPKLPEKNRAKIQEPELAPSYEYDSWRILVRGTSTVLDGNKPVQLDNVAREHLLPPIVQVTMVAVDEPSMQRLDLTKDNPPDWTVDLFKKATLESDYLSDLKSLETDHLQKVRGLNYRIFSTDVVIRGSKWSKDPTNAQQDVVN